MRLCLDLEARDAALGLATDEALLESVRNGGEDTIRVWVSKRAVILGRSQSAADECDREAARRLAIPIVRRLSGGGSVYHYPGNLNVTVTAADSRRFGTVEGAFACFGESLAAGLRSGLGAAVDAHGRTLVVGERKISGAAQARRGKAILIHGTMLVWPDTVEMAAVLRALRPEYAPQSTPSCPQATTTLSDVLARPVGLAEAAGAVLQGLASLLPRPWSRTPIASSERTVAAELEAARYRNPEWNESR
jgi:lipoate-protein ligase A